MTPQEFKLHIHPREAPRFVLALLFVLPVGFAIAAASLLSGGLLISILLAIAFLFWVMLETSYALIIANWVLVSEDNYPRLQGILDEMKQKISVDAKIDMIVYQSAEFNVLFALLFSRRAIFINSELLAEGVSDNELRWLIGRWVGRIRAKRRVGPLRYLVAFVEQFLAFNLFIYPYERATAYSGDRIALGAIGGDLSAAISAMNKLMVGREIGYSVNPSGVVRQYRRVKGSLFGFLARLTSPLPHMTSRYVDLIGFAQQQYPEAYEQFAAMNPSLQVAGGPWKLMWSTEKKGDRTANWIGVGMLGGAIVFAAVGGVVFMQMYQNTYSSDYSSDYEQEALYAAQAEDDAYSQAQSADTQDGYRAYLSAYPSGRYVVAAQTALDALIANDITGVWTFSTVSYSCGFFDQCYIRGTMYVEPANGGFNCSFSAVEVRSSGQSSADERCWISESADGVLSVASTVVSSSSSAYVPDNFTLRRDNGRLTGALNSSVNVSVEFVRPSTTTP